MVQGDQKRLIRIALHVLFWLIFLSVLNSSALGLTWGPFSYENGTFLISSLYGMAINAALFYLNVYRMIPRYLHQRKLRDFWWGSAAMILGFTILEFGIDTYYLFTNDALQAELREVDGGKYENNEWMLSMAVWMSTTFLINVFFWAMAFLFRFPQDWRRNERSQQKLVEDKLRAELDFLKAQMDPHFVFNGINSIYHLIGEDDEKAKSVLLQFSELLRYQLYECKEQYISLHKELNFIKNYILLETVRKGEDASISINLPASEDLKQINDLLIAPLILTPFLENAFKHLSLYSQKENNQLCIQIRVADKNLYLEVENSMDPLREDQRNRKSSGIGLDNVKRRLAILYPNKHQLNISVNSKTFAVSLQVALT